METPPPITTETPARRGWLGRAKLDLRSCVVVNLLACPGLGTVLAGRRFGWSQLGIMVIGFLLAMKFLLTFLGIEIRMALHGSSFRVSRWQEIAWMGKWGFELCGVAWGWAGLSSLQIWKEHLASQPAVKKGPPQPPSL